MPTEATCALTSMRAELEGEPNEPSDDLAEARTPLACDAHGSPIDFEITGGDVHDAKAAIEIIRKIGAAENFIADKGYDSEEIRERARSKGRKPIIPRKSNSKKPNPEFDSPLDKMRHLIENLFARLKHYLNIATHFK